jgi:hypothetical protein
MLTYIIAATLSLIDEHSVRQDFDSDVLWTQDMVQYRVLKDKSK